MLSNDKNIFKGVQYNPYLLKAFLVNRLEVEGGDNMIKHQFGGHCNPQFTGKCRTSSSTSPTRRTAAGPLRSDGAIFIARRNIPYYSKALHCVNQF